MITIKIDRDYLSAPHEESRAGSEFETPYIEGTKVRFRCKDDDGGVYYGGWLINDDWANNQFEILRWTMADAGCTTIEVKLNDEWVQEIG